MDLFYHDISALVFKSLVFFFFFKFSTNCAISHNVILLLVGLANRLFFI